MLAEAADFIARIGFPIWVAVYSLVSFRASIDRNTATMERLYNKLEGFLEAVARGGD